MHYHLLDNKFGEDSTRNQVQRASKTREGPENKTMKHFLSLRPHY